jgi:GNAT superfamily N-acetyltransferase
MSLERYALRRMLPGDAPGVAACARAIYGESYARPEIYSPRALLTHNGSGAWISLVAVHDGHVVGHMALEPSAMGRVAEMGMGMVLPEHRRHGVLERLRDFAVAESTRLGLGGQFVELETSNVAAQNLANRSPAQPTGLTLGLWPGAPRRSFLRYFRYLDKPAAMTLDVPERHREIVARIYAQLGVEVRFTPGAGAQGDERLWVERHSAWGSVFVAARGVSLATIAELEAFHAAFVADASLEAAFLEVPLAQAQGAALCAAAERLGFFFCGVSPHGAHDGDALRLQRLKTPVVLPELGHPMARELWAHVEAAQRDAGNQV